MHAFYLSTHLIKAGSILSAYCILSVGIRTPTAASRAFEVHRRFEMGYTSEVHVCHG